MERNISSACSMLSHVHDGAGNLLHTVSRHLCTRIGLQLTFTGSLKSTQIRNIATKDPSLHDYNLDRPLLCIYQSRASCYSCKDPIAAALSELTETRQLIFNYAWAVFVWVVGEVWFWVSNCLHFFHSAPGVGFEVKPVLRWRCACRIWRLQSIYLGTWKEHR